MSADNAIVIAQFPDGYRVAHVGNPFELADNEFASQDETDVLRTYLFGETKVFQSEEEASLQARKMECQMIEEDGVPPEYGIIYMEFDRALLGFDRKTITKMYMGQFDSQQ